MMRQRSTTPSYNNLGNRSDSLSIPSAAAEAADGANTVKKEEASAAGGKDSSESFAGTLHVK